MTKILVFVFITFQLAQAESFLRNDQFQSKATYTDYNGDGTEESKSEYVYELNIKQWFYSSYNFDSSSGSWVPYSIQLPAYDPTVNQVFVPTFYGVGAPPSSCVVYDVDLNEQRATRSYYVGSDSCELAKSYSASTYQYDSSRRLVSTHTYLASPAGVFDWTKPNSSRETIFGTHGKPLKYTDNYGTDFYSTEYIYDANDILVSTESYNSYNMNMRTVTQYVYDSVGDLVETNSFTVDNGNILYMNGVKRMSYDPVLLQKKTLSFYNPTDADPYGWDIRTYDQSGNPILDQNGYGSSSTTSYSTRYEY